MPQFLPFDAVGTEAGDPNFPNMIGGGGGVIAIHEYFPVRGVVVGGTENFNNTNITTITLDDATNFPTSGNGTIRGPGNANTGGRSGSNQFSQAQAAISWSGKTGNMLTGVSNTGGDNAVGRSWLHGHTVIDIDTASENIFSLTLPENTMAIYVEGAGGGAGGGNGANLGVGGNAQGGGGGGGGEYGFATLNVTAGNTIGIRVGFSGFTNSAQNTNISTTSTTTFTDTDALVFFAGTNGNAGGNSTLGNNGGTRNGTNYFATNGSPSRPSTDSSGNSLFESFGRRGNSTGSAGDSGGGGGYGGAGKIRGGDGGNGIITNGHDGGGGAGGGGGWTRGISGTNAESSGSDRGIGCAGGMGGIRIYVLSIPVTTTFGT